jgi:hypothetical protein
MSTETRWIIKAVTGYRAVALAAAIVLPVAVASAQTAAPTNPVFYKGKGVGGDNSYFNRYEEDSSFPASRPISSIGSRLSKTEA